MIPLSSTELDKMFELSKFDDAVFVGSEIRALIGTIRYYKNSYVDLLNEMDDERNL